MGRERRQSEPGEGPGPLPENGLASIFPWRGAVAGFFGVAVGCVLTAYSSLYLDSSLLGDDYLPIGAFSLFLGLLLINALLRRAGRGLTRSDVHTAYIMMLVSAAVPVNGFAARVLPMITGLYYYATPANGWEEYFYRHVPNWLGPRDRDVARTFYEGTITGNVPWESWLKPLAVWFIPFAGLALMILALGIFLRRQWIENERLVFPLAQVAVAVTGSGNMPTFETSLIRNRLFWVAVLVPFAINALNGLHHLYPVIPNIPAMDPDLKTSLGGYLTDPIQQYMYRDFYFEFHFALIGVAMMMRQEVSLSLWFFQVFFVGVIFVFMVTGLGPGQYMYTPKEQFGYVMFARWTKIGGAVVVVAVILWSLRHEFVRAWRAAFGHRPVPEEGAGPLGFAFWMFVAGLAAYAGWTRALGLPTGAALAMLAITLGAYIVVARIVSEGGLIWCSVAMDPVLIYPALVGTSGLSAQTITAMAYTGFVPLAARANVLPSVMDSFKIAQGSRIRPSHVIILSLASLALAFVVSLAVVLAMTYAQGGNYMPQKHYSYGPRWIFGKAASFFTDVTGPSWQAIATMITGIAIMGGMYKLHRRYLWWPFYPLGFVIAETEVMQHQWMSIAIGWAIRSLVIRFGGAAGYRSNRPAAIGVIIGELSSIMFWFAVFALTGTTGKSLTHATSTW